MRHGFYFTKKEMLQKKKSESRKGCCMWFENYNVLSLSKRKIYFNFSRISFSTRSYACAAIRKKSANYKIITTIQNKIKKKLSVGVKKYYMKQNSTCLKGLFSHFPFINNENHNWDDNDECGNLYCMILALIHSSYKMCNKF